MNKLNVINKSKMGIHRIIITSLLLCFLTTMFAQEDTKAYAYVRNDMAAKENLRHKAIVEGDFQAYDSLIYYVPYCDYLFYSIYMINEYNNPKAYYNIYMLIKNWYEWLGTDMDDNSYNNLKPLLRLGSDAGSIQCQLLLNNATKYSDSDNVPFVLPIKEKYIYDYICAGPTNPEIKISSSEFQKLRTEYFETKGANNLLSRLVYFRGNGNFLLDDYVGNHHLCVENYMFRICDVIRYDAPISAGTHIWPIDYFYSQMHNLYGIDEHSYYLSPFVHLLWEKGVEDGDNMSALYLAEVCACGYGVEPDRAKAKSILESVPKTPLQNIRPIDTILKSITNHCKTIKGNSKDVYNNF